MKLTLSTIDNSYSINFEGTTKVVPSKYGLTSVRTLGGRMRQEWRGEFDKITVDINYISDENYKIMKYIWRNYTLPLNLYCEQGIKSGNITNSSLDFSRKIDSEGNIFYIGTLYMEE